MRKVIVIGGSAGAIQGFCSILQLLPANLTAAVLAVIHTSEEGNQLPNVLARCSRLKVVAPVVSAPIAEGNVYLPAPNRHLIVKNHCAISCMGPRENRHRPAVDTLFRSAARAYRNRVIAVILSGALDDGSAGALAVKVRGGTVIVQKPEDAVIPDMPRNVMRQVEVDHCLPAAEIPALLVQLASKGRAIKYKQPSAKECSVLAQTAFEEVEPTGLTCPDCGGVVEKIQSKKNTQFRCHVGHVFSVKSFDEAHADALERALWVALRKLNEQRSIQEHLGYNGRETEQLRKRYQENAESTKRDIRLLHEIMGRLNP